VADELAFLLILQKSLGEFQLRAAARRSYQCGGRNPKSLSNFVHSQSMNQSLLIDPALSATSDSALPILPFKQ